MLTCCSSLKGPKRGGERRSTTVLQLLTFQSLLTGGERKKAMEHHAYEHIMERLLRMEVGLAKLEASVAKDSASIAEIRATVAKFSASIAKLKARQAKLSDQVSYLQKRADQDDRMKLNTLVRDARIKACQHNPRADGIRWDFHFSKFTDDDWKKAGVFQESIKKLLKYGIRP